MCLNMFENNGNMFCSAGFEDGSFNIYDLKSSKPIFEKQVFKDPILCIKNTQDNIILGPTGNFIVILQNDKIIAKHELKESGINDISIRDNRLFCTAGWDSKIRVFDLKKNVPLVILKYHSSGVNSVDYNENKLISGSKDHRIAIWNIEFKKKQKEEK